MKKFKYFVCLVLMAVLIMPLGDFVSKDDFRPIMSSQLSKTLFDLLPDAEAGRRLRAMYLNQHRAVIARKNAGGGAPTPLFLMDLSACGSPPCTDVATNSNFGSETDASGYLTIQDVSGTNMLQESYNDAVSYAQIDIGDPIPEVYIKLKIQFNILTSVAAVTNWSYNIAINVFEGFSERCRVRFNEGNTDTLQYFSGLAQGDYGNVGEDIIAAGAQINTEYTFKIRLKHVDGINDEMQIWSDVDGTYAGSEGVVTDVDYNCTAGFDVFRFGDTANSNLDGDFAAGGLVWKISYIWIGADDPDI